MGNLDDLCGFLPSSLPLTMPLRDSAKVWAKLQKKMFEGEEGKWDITRIPYLEEDLIITKKIADIVE